MLLHHLLKKAFELRIKILTGRKIKQILQNIAGNGKLWVPDKQVFGDHDKLFQPIRKRTNRRWLKVYGTISGIHDSRYIPEDLYYSEIEPRLNYKPLSKAYTDKNIYPDLLKGFLLPKTIIRNVNGVLYDAEWNSISEHRASEIIMQEEDRKLVIKPSVESGGGRSVRVIKAEKNGISTIPPDGKITTSGLLFSLYGTNFIVQEFINQHSFLINLNSSSVNTIRILTYRSVADQKVHVLHRIMRMGQPGSIVDNQAAGGLACGIGSDGRMADFAVDKKGNKYFSHNGNSFESAGIVPFLDLVCGQAVRVAEYFPYARLLGTDFTINESGLPVLLEVNNMNNEINFYQMTGGPLFGEFTGEILDFCASHPASFLIDFDI